MLTLLFLFLALLLFPLALGFLYFVCIILAQVIFLLFWPWAKMLEVLGIFKPFLAWYTRHGVSIPIYFMDGRQRNSWRECFRMYEAYSDPNRFKNLPTGW